MDERALADLIYRYGDERFSRRIARRIVDRRPFTTTEGLADAIRGAYPPPARRGRIDPATRTFQALRIAVNDELGELETFLADFPRRLAPGGRLAVLAYHSLEDRIVKDRFREEAARSRVRAAGSDDEGPRVRLLTRKPVRPSEDEVRAQPRVRSARLRVVERVPDGDAER